MDSSFINRDILTGDFRRIDLFSKPYNFPTNPLYVIEDWIFPDPERQMCLWDREQVILALRTFWTYPNLTVIPSVLDENLYNFDLLLMCFSHLCR